MTKWRYQMVEIPLEITRSPRPIWVEADPAADPEVQARVLRAAAKQPTHSGKWGPKTIGALNQMANDIEAGNVTLQVEEPKE